MKKTFSAILCALSLMLPLTFAQGERAGITGAVTDPDGGGVVGVTVTVKSIESGKLYTAVSDAKGNFVVPDLVPGGYDMSVPAIGFTFVPYARRNVAVQRGETLRADIRLQWVMNLGTAGDDTYLTIRNRYAGLSGPAPHLPDGMPDLSGVWQGGPDPDPEPAAPQEWAGVIGKQRLQDNIKDSPTAFCLPGWVVVGLPILYKIVQTPKLVLELFELEPHDRQIFTDGRQHPSDPDPTWVGHSIGRWEGETLVVDTIGYNDKSWLPTALPHTEKLHIVERYHRPDLAHLNVDVTVDDPGALMKPWQLHMIWTLAPGEEIMEAVCENNQYRPDRK